MIPPDAFQILHCESVLRGGTLQRGANLLSNPGFETGDFTGWATTTNWSVAASGSLSPVTNGNYGAGAGVGAGAVTATLESNRFAVTANSFYYAQLYFGSSGGVQNTLVVKIRWWAGAVGGSPVGESVLYSAPVQPGGNLQGVTGRFYAPGTTTYASVQLVNYANAGAGAGTVVDDLFVAAEVAASEPQLLETLEHASNPKANGFLQLAYGTHYRAGYKECRFNLHGEPAYLWNWLLTALGEHLKVNFDDGQVWTGMIWELEGKIDGVPRRVSMDALLNLIRVQYRGGAWFPSQDVASQKRFGCIEKLESHPELWLNEASDRANYLIYGHAWPNPAPDWARSGESDDNTLQVRAMGYWSTLAFVRPTGFRGKAKAEISNLICLGTGSTILQYIRHRGNIFISADYSRVRSTGRSINPRDDADAPRGGDGLSLIEGMLAAGDSNKRTLISGVWENRQFVLRPRATTYEFVKQGKDYYDSGGAPIPAARLQAGHFLKGSRPVPTWSTFADVVNDPTCAFLSEVTYQAESGEVLALTPDAAALDTSLAGAMDLVLD